jgi:hypothetical protein
MNAPQTPDSPLLAYERALAGGFVADAAQRRAVEALQHCHEAVHRGEQTPGVYLWGPVGRGKTWLMDSFYNSLRVPARRQHFHHFMQWVHRRQFQLTGNADPLRLLAEELGREVRVLCFDELFVSDIGDAMLLGRLLSLVVAQGVVLVATSNQPPDQLYADGYNRERFLPAIAALKAHMRVVTVDGEQDHRLHPGSVIAVSMPWGIARRRCGAASAICANSRWPQPISSNCVSVFPPFCSPKCRAWAASSVRGASPEAPRTVPSGSMQGIGNCRRCRVMTMRYAASSPWSTSATTAVCRCTSRPRWRWRSCTPRVISTLPSAAR